MFKWLKDWLNPTPYTTDTVFDTDASMPKCKPPRKDGESPSDYKKRVGIDKNDIVLDISEPVYSFVKTVKANPRRFKVESTADDYFNQNPGSSIYIANYSCYGIEDLLTNKKYTIQYLFYQGLKGKAECSFLTNDECNYLVKEIRDVYTERYYKLKDLKEKRQRKALIKIYGEGK